LRENPQDRADLFIRAGIKYEILMDERIFVSRSLPDIAKQKTP